MSESAVAQIGRWSLTGIPAGWDLHPGFGVVRRPWARGAPNICLREDVLLAGRLLAPYISTQQTLLRRNLPECLPAGPSVVPFDGADEAMLLLLKYPATAEAPLTLQAQTYVRKDTWIGIVTLTSAAVDMPALKADYRAFLAGLRVTDHTSSHEPAASTTQRR